MTQHTTRLLAVSLLAGLCLAACGGGGASSSSRKFQPSAVKVAGASLADSGTFGYKFTLQAASGAAYQVYSERLAATYGFDSCNHYASANGGVSYTANSACNNFAVAGGAINYGALNTTAGTFTPAASSPGSEIQQLSDQARAGYAADDLVLVGEGSANDTANLLATLQYQLANPSGTLLYQLMVSSGVLSASQFAATNPASDGGLAAGTLYMQALADKLATAIRSSVLANGVTHVVVLNTLDVTKTPEFVAALLAVNQAYGSTVANQVQAAATQWIQAYNTRLASDLAPYANAVAVVDFYSAFNAEIASPAQYGLSNVGDTVCDQINAQLGSSTYTVTTASAGSTALTTPAVVGLCTDANASSITPSTGGTSSWWKTYLFADHFHPTPYGHQLLAQLVAQRLTQVGWL